MKSLHGVSVHISGIVQGVGFRPFVYGLANRLALTGWVKNTSAGVDIEVNGSHESIESFVTALRQNPPPLAMIDEIEVQKCPPNGFETFIINNSEPIPNAFIPISPDVGICPDCLHELFDEQNRRHLYPFINCTNCGPRFTIIKDIPYDRPYTTMAGFEMCPSCYAEYTDPTDRRFHAQPIACPECGPSVWLEVGDNVKAIGDLFQVGGSKRALSEGQRLLMEGNIVAVKGLGGFHLSCDATNEKAATELRRRKLRVDKPFALMMRDIETIERHCFVGSAERELLESHERPIVILQRKPSSTIAQAVAPRQNTIGVMLPYTPLHYLLFADLEPHSVIKQTNQALTALVMTSGNLIDEPIAVDNQEARNRLSSLADAFLMHNRPIYIRCDDSVTRVLNPSAHREPSTIHVRRSRGYVPFPVQLPWSLPAVLAAGPELKNTFCITKGRYAFLSHHIGDLENYETLESFEEGITHFERLFRTEPRAIAFDLHPDYMATQYALRRAAQDNLPAIGVQHHHAHIAACMAENRLALDHPRAVLGVSFDGTGYGEDGAIWGGEFLISDYHHYRRVFHLEYVPLPGGDKAIKEPWRMALAWLANAEIEWNDDLFPLRHVQSSLHDPGLQLDALKNQLRTHINAPLTSSMGRLFDAVASLCGIRHEVNYEAQAAIELEALVDRQETTSYQFKLRRGNIEIASTIQALISDIRSGVPIPVIAARFHNTIAQIVLNTALAVRKECDINEIALSGGVWQNMILLDRTIKLLQSADFKVYIHQKVPTNDGGVSLGQAVVAAARLSESCN